MPDGNRLSVLSVTVKRISTTDRFRLNAAFSGSPDINSYGVVGGGSFTLN